ncbi:hypothetical protein [Helicobacter sp. MIT 11-5569]|nr:hypothetical protein [Helicobacter sp. MIT 11-5569]
MSNYTEKDLENFIEEYLLSKNGIKRVSKAKNPSLIGIFLLTYNPFI